MRFMIAAAVLSLMAGQAHAADPVEGDWMPDSGTKVHVAPCAAHADQMCGVITWMKNPNNAAGQPARDTSNPDPSLRGRTLVGLPFIRDFHRAEPGRWTGGKIYDPDSGKTYNSKMQVGADGALKVAGCVLVFCQAQSWRRAPF
jgi:uncharacterized protein (DUF2147 family)